jgi:hypothetical protein
MDFELNRPDGLRHGYMKKAKQWLERKHASGKREQGVSARHQVNRVVPRA